MAKYFMLKEPSNLMDDCALNANVITKVTETDRFRLIEEVGTWYYVKTNTGVVGWINTYLNNRLNIIEDYKLGSLGIKIGDYFTLKSDDKFINDLNGNQVQTHNGTVPVNYVISNITRDPDCVYTVYDGKEYKFSIDDIESDNLVKESDFGFSLQTFDGKADEADANKKAGETDANKKEKEAQQAEVEKNKETKTILDSALNAVRYAFQDHNQKLAKELNTMNIKNLQGVFGMPYQFTDIADMRLDQNPDTPDQGPNPFITFGQTYAEKIVARMPLLTIIPGNAKFMAKFTDEQKKSVISEVLKGAGADENENTLKSVLKESGQYYNFYADWVGYYRYVNTLCHIAAVLMKVDDIEIPTSAKGGGTAKLRAYDWQKVGDNPITGTLSYRNAMCFYLNADNQVSESFSNETTKTQLADKINGISDKMREMQFLMGATTGLGGSLLGKNDMTMAGQKDKASGDGILGKFFGNSNGSSGSDGILGSLLSGMGAIIEGSKMRFPEIWADSQFSKDYNISMRFMTPDCDNLSVYLNVIVPLIHVICLAAPRATGANTYGAPFMIRCFYRGFFNIDLGMITSLSINKGGEGKWSYSNIPTEVEVNMTVKDLYSVMAMSMNDSSHANLDVTVLSNNTLMDYLSNMCGVNFSEIDIGRTLTLYKVLITNKANMFLPNIAGELNQWVYNKLVQYGGFHDYR